MDLKELDSFRLSDAISFHDDLNPKLWRGDKLIPLVKEQLLTIAQDFLEELGVNELDVRDITISGSNAAYTYTKHSDLDLHILVNMDDLPQSDVYKELFNAKKNIYNDTHDITVHGVPVELYVQDAKQPVKSLGEYSIKNDKWLRIPTKRRANFDQTATKVKYEKLLELVNTALKTKDVEKLNKILKKIKQYRQAGLDKGGEFGPENLAYKALRSQGYITKLYALRDKLHSERLSIEGMYSQPKKVDKLTDDLRKEFEDYDPNGPPPGPEFKPTMPKGTVRVDVSDVYDWYKLGQHISNLKGLGKHDFGKGPPSTILSFGDEDTEHQYIQDLEKTGLSTTDIDPVDPNQPKGMKRQKVDPTFNVNESEFNKCFDKACKLYDKAVEKGLEPILYQVADYKGDGSNADNRWAKLPQHVWSHYVTVIGDTVFDPTAKQFGDDKQEKYSIDKLKSEWNKIYKIRPREMNEAFDKPYPIKWEKSEHGDYDALAELDDGTYLSIMFNNQVKKNWMVEFYRNNSQEVTGEGDAQRVFATVLTAIGQFIKKKKPDNLVFLAVKEDDPTGSRTKLYSRLVQRYANSVGYSVQQQDNPGGMSYQLTRGENVKETLEDWRPYQGLRKAKNELGVNLFPGKDIVGQRVYHCTNSLKSIQKTGGLKPKADETGAKEYGRLSTNEHPFIPVVGVWFSVGKPDWPGKYCLSFVIEPTDKVYVAYAKSDGELTPNVVLNSIPWDRLTVDPTFNVNEEGVAEGTEPDYMAGHCHVMALALKKLNPDWKIRAHIGWDEDAEDDSDYRVDHVYIVAPDGSAYDCRGKFSNEQELVGPDETGGVETQFVDYSIDDIKHDVARGELKRFGKKDLARAVKFIQSKQGVAESASGYIPSNAEKDDPRFRTALTVDIKPDTLKKNAKKLGFKISRAGIPPLLREGKSELVVYHGSQQDDIQAFKPFTHFGTFMAAKERLEDKMSSQNRNQNIYKVSLNLKKPAHIHKDAYGNHTLMDYIVGLHDSGILTNDDKIYSPEALIKVLKSKGYDGISYFNKWEDRGSISYIIFDSNQATILDIITWANGKMSQYLRKFRKKN